MKKLLCLMFLMTKPLYASQCMGTNQWSIDKPSVIRLTSFLRGVASVLGLESSIFSTEDRDNRYLITDQTTGDCADIKKFQNIMEIYVESVKGL